MHQFGAEGVGDDPRVGHGQEAVGAARKDDRWLVAERREGFAAFVFAEGQPEAGDAGGVASADLVGGVGYVAGVGFLAEDQPAQGGA